MGGSFRKPLRPELPQELVPGWAHPGLLPAARPGGPEQAAPRGRVRLRAELRLRLRALRPLRTDTGGVPPPLRRRVGAGVGPGGAPRGALFLQGREGPSHSLRPAARGRGMYTREEAEDKFFRVAELLGAEVVGGPEELRKYTEEEASWW